MLRMDTPRLPTTIKECASHRLSGLKLSVLGVSGTMYPVETALFCRQRMHLNGKDSWLGVDSSQVPKVPGKDTYRI